MKSQQELIQQYGAQKVITTLDPYVSEARKVRIAEVLKGRLQSIQLAMEAPSDINNALAAVRTSEALGISTVHLIMPQGDVKYARAITQGAIYWVDVIFYDSLAEFFETMRKNSIQIAAAIASATMPLSQVPVSQPLCILLGNERRGLSEAAQNAADLHYKIPMFGMTESLNLSVSAAISLYDLSERKRRLIQEDTDLTQDAIALLQAKFYLKSVDPRFGLALLSARL